MQICRLGNDHLREALDLVWEVFERFEADDYSEMGVKTFRHFIEYHSILDRVDQGNMKFWGCYLNNYLVGVIALREGQHISLLFVREKFHHLGVASMLVRVVENDVRAMAPKIPAITVNSSPYAVGFYRAVGFKAVKEEQQSDGIRYTPMTKLIGSK
ncbi:MAG: GNAT family N-acetyltransferase [Eubacterium sp.]|nr:GNAT family N-acetyltransferase [Eubacterium sp.]